MTSFMINGEHKQRQSPCSPMKRTNFLKLKSMYFLYQFYIWMSRTRFQKCLYFVFSFGLVANEIPIQIISNNIK
jgi:hypothetical protein